jgi:uncharacterized membrane protein
MKNFLGFLKTTILGGVVFLLPLALLIFVASQAIEIMTRITEPILSWIPKNVVEGMVLRQALVILALLLICFIAGFVAKSVFGNRFFTFIEGKLRELPGYSMIKARLTGSIGSSLEKESFKPVIVILESREQIAFEVERISGNRVVLFLPGSPDPWTGQVIIVESDQIKPLTVDMHSALKVFNDLGRGTSKIFKPSSP